MRHHRPHNSRLQTAESMIAETEAFLNWALDPQGAALPRIPRRRVDQGGFTQLLRRPGARAAVIHWWQRVLTQIP